MVIARFDHVFGPDVEQNSIFNALLADFDAALTGRNLTVFGSLSKLKIAYGQSGAGKTHTINGSKQDFGLIPKTLDYLLNNSLVSDVSVSWMQVYNEKILDLLSPSNASVDLREVNKTLMVSGQTAISVKSMDEFWIYHE